MSVEDKQWARMHGAERQRLEQRIMHGYAKLVTKKAAYNSEKKLVKIKALEEKIWATLDDSKVTNMVNIQQDKLRALYFMWIDGKEKEFSELQAQAAAKLAEKDAHDYVRAELMQEVATLKHSCAKW